MSEIKRFFEEIEASIQNDTLVKLTLSKPPKKTADLINVYVRQVVIKNQKKFSFNYRYKTNDQVKNYSFDEALTELESLIGESFKLATLFTLSDNFELKINKKGKISVRKTAPTFSNKLPEVHDNQKKKRASKSEFLFHLGISDADGNVIPKMADKFKQINKYLEIIDGLIKSTNLPKKVNIVDMGSGKGYLTFALYDFLTNTRKLDVSVVGIELRKELVDYCNDIATKCEYTNLKFVSQRIEEFDNNKIDILIALHACDTATDDAIFKGLQSKASLIVCAPCCHKQVRQSLKGVEQENPILKYGIFKERQFEMITDTVRALIMEKHQYQTKVFEFISNEHTRKNIMLVGTKAGKSPNTKSIDSKIDSLKKEFGVEEHYLETLVK